MTVGTAADISRLTCETRAIDLGAGPAPDEVLRRLSGEPGLACLWGSWAAGTSIMSRPLVTSDDVAALDLLPAVAPAGGVTSGVTGGGWLGWLGYDCPAHLAFYDHLLRHKSGRWSFESLWSPPREAALVARLAQLCAVLAGPPAEADWQLGQFGGASQSRHLRAVEEAIGLIRAGELYQVNVCTRLSARFAGSAAGLFASAAATLQPTYGAFVQGSSRALASFSPELFLHRQGRDVTTSPIKGTRARDATELGARELRRSAKDTAENVMIVDLMRNDLGRVCEPGSVRPRELLGIQAHPGVWHLVSTIDGRLRPDVTDAGLFAAAFPPGSVTGAPKLRAVEAIAELEDVPRGIYTGAIGFAGPTVGVQLNVAIRSFEIAAGRIELGVGGGITAESVPELEWRECLHKAAPLLGAVGSALEPGVDAGERLPSAAQRAGGLIETMLAVDGIVLRLADHLTRLDLSCRELYGAGLPAQVATAVRSAAGSGRMALRLVVTPALEFTVHAAPAPVPPACTELRTVTGRGGVWRHKWADRAWLTSIEAAGSALFVADDGAVLETSRGNVFMLCANGTLVTSPLRDDVLPGITRRALLDLARDDGRPVELRDFTVAEMRAAAAFWTSSLSGLVPIGAVDGRPIGRRDLLLAELAARLGWSVGAIDTGATGERRLAGATDDR